MFIKNTTNTSREELAQAAYSTFVNEGVLKIHVNRKHTLKEIPIFEKGGPFPLSQSIRDECVKFAAMKVDDIAAYFFRSFDGSTCCIDSNVVDRFTEMARSTFPALKFERFNAIVDVKTGVELMPTGIIDQYPSYPEEISFDYKRRLSALVITKDI